MPRSPCGAPLLTGLELDHNSMTTALWPQHILPGCPPIQNVMSQYKNTVGCSVESLANLGQTTFTASLFSTNPVILSQRTLRFSGMIYLWYICAVGSWSPSRWLCTQRCVGRGLTLRFAQELNSCPRTSWVLHFTWNSAVPLLDLPCFSQQHLIFPSTFKFNGSVKSDKSLPRIFYIRHLGLSSSYL